MNFLAEIVGPVGLIFVALGGFVAGAISVTLVASYAWQAHSSVLEDRKERFRDKIRSRFKRHVP